MNKQQLNIKTVGILFIGCFAASFSAIFIKVCDDNPIIIANYRLLFASILLFPFWLSVMMKKRAERNKSDSKQIKKQLMGVIFPGFFMALHFMSWIGAVKLTTVANSTMIINVQIIIIPILGFLFLKEKVTVWEIVGIASAFLGMTIVGIGDFRLEPMNFRGDLLTFFSANCLAIYILLGRSFRRIVDDSGSTHLIEYIFPVYTTAFVFITIFCLISGIGLGIRSWSSFFWIVMLTLVPTIIGHSLINWSLRYVKPQIVGLFILGEFPISTILAYLLLTELPKHLFYIGAPLVVLGIIIALMRKD